MQASENTSAIFNRSARDLVQTPLSDFLDDAAITILNNLTNGKTTDKIPLVWTIQGRQHLAVVHIKDTYILAELEVQPYEESDQRSFVSIYQEIKYSMALIGNATTSTEVCTIAAKELRRISGFDKVMIYRFDEEWNGTVIAEERSENKIGRASCRERV